MKTTPILFLCLTLLLTAEPVPAEATGPMETLKVPVKKVINLLKDPQYNTSEKREVQRRKLYEYTGHIFDSVAVSRRALGRYWKKFTPQERQKFTELFSKILKKTYSRKIQGVQEDYDVTWLGEKKISSTKAVVMTKVLRPSGDFPVEYRMHLKNKAWKVYDVRVEGISLIKNFRSQFSKFLINKKPAALIAQLQEKVNRFEKE